MSSRVHVMLQMDEGTGDGSLDALLNDLSAQAGSGLGCTVLPGKDGAPATEAARPRNALRRADTPVPTEDGRRTILLSFPSGTRVSIDAYAQEAASKRGDRATTFRFAFSLDDTMHDIHACWNGEAYELDE